MNRGVFKRVLRHFLSYSINKCDLNTMVGNVNFFLRALTVNIDKRNTKPISVISYILTIIGLICYYYVYVVSVAWYV
ncbi:uncharacterized protein LOC125061046 [Pieris napi]|uniref:uncharacterized protein LOC125061046 n=1 Tax=Pieris napi TaxID=78633 RepID=UPI001FB92E0A|nr:uncharacterized protein LOC125061046 [Pieris napi]